MVRGQWNTTVDGMLHYGAPAHDGSIELTELFTKDPNNGDELHHVHFAIKRVLQPCGTLQNGFIAIPVEHLPELIKFLQDKLPTQNQD